MHGRRAAAPRAERSAAAELRPWFLLPMSAAIIALAVVAGAALVGPWQMAAPEPPRYETPPPTATAAPAPTDPAEAPPPDEQSDSSQPLSFAVALIVVVGALLLGYVLARLVRRASETHISDDARPEAAEGALLMDATVPEQPRIPVLRRGVGAARAVLAERDAPDDAIVAAWVELEAAAASSGVHRAPSATPTEFTAAVLTSTRADAEAIRTLLRLYHRARFGRNGRITTAELSEARRCLERLAASWEAR